MGFCLYRYCYDSNGDVESRVLVVADQSMSKLGFEEKYMSPRYDSSSSEDEFEVDTQVISVEYEHEL